MRNIFLFFLLVAMHASAQGNDDVEIEQRIKPVGNVRIEGATQTTNTPTVLPENITPQEKMTAGQETYQTYCATCHASGIAGAPKFRSVEDWKPRLAKGSETLLKNSIKGINAMPPKGTCAECADADLKAAIDYMSQVKK
jgi:cytochrome c5